MRLLPLLLLVPILVAAGCGDDDRRSSDAAFDPGSQSDVIGTDINNTDGGASDAATMDVPAASEGLSIVFDYRFDRSGFFTEPSRKETLNAAAVAWSGLLLDDFEDIPEGTPIRTRDPEAPEADGMTFPSGQAIDDVLIFVACASFSGGIAQSYNSAAINSLSDTTLAAKLRERYEGADFEPWTGWITFNCDSPWYFDATPDTADDIPAEANDFFSTAMHEIGHVLGFGTSDAHFALVVDGSFTGPAATAAHGSPVPLTSSGVHFQSSVTSEGQVTLMDVSRTVGTRTPPTRLDRAVMADLGYEPAP